MSALTEPLCAMGLRPLPIVVLALCMTGFSDPCAVSAVTLAALEVVPCEALLIFKDVERVRRPFCLTWGLLEFADSPVVVFD